MLYDKRWEYDPVCDVLYRAADLIDQRGLTKYCLVDHEGKLCTLGAINMAITGNPYYGGYCSDKEKENLLEETQNRIISRLSALNRIYDVVDWNNRPERTKKEVVDALREVAAALP
jgi:hypothetical protein